MVALFHTVIICHLFLSILSTNAHDSSDVKKSHTSHADDSSDVDHDVDGVHNPLYDQEALFGKDARRLDDLTPEEGMEQLRILAKKMDTDNDGYVTPDELKAWLQKIQQHLGVSDAKRVWEEHGLKPDQKLSWDVYSKYAVEKDGIYDGEDDEEQASHMARDKLRWSIADEDKDGELTLNEAVNFLHPESDPRMHDILAQETIDEMDTNKDGSIDIDEFIRDLWRPSDSQPNEPDWIQSEREDFINVRDKNKDGKLDREEIKEWRFATDHDYIEHEAQHIFDQCDTDRDMRLTADEITHRYDLFSQSPATNFGDALTDHDEL